MREMSSYDVGMSSGNMFYVLPFSYSPTVSAEQYGRRVEELFADVDYSVSRIQPHAPVRVDCENDCVRVHLKYLFEGYDDWYLVVMRLEVVKSRDDSRMLLVGHYEHEQNGLFDEIIQDKVLPQWAKLVHIKSFHNE